jgi:heme/copper-type cytochrome/quinol oxidase subunit 2
MNCFRRRPTFFTALLPAAMLVLLLAGVASACPTCKDSLANDPASASLVRGFYYSIVFMVSMPYVIFGSLAAYFYWQIRKARAKQAAEAEQPRIAVE